MLRASLLLVLLAFAASAGEPSPEQKEPRSGNSGIRGVVMAGPVGPPTRDGGEESAPLPNAWITVEPAKGGKEVARARSDTKGRFRIPLPPGTYRLVPLPLKPNQPYPLGKPQKAVVTAGKWVEVTVEYDTGIR
jgi:hypothetical protein